MTRTPPFRRTRTRQHLRPLPGIATTALVASAVLPVTSRAAPTSTHHRFWAQAEIATASSPHTELHG